MVGHTRQGTKSIYLLELGLVALPLADRGCLLTGLLFPEARKLQVVATWSPLHLKQVCLK